MAGRILLVDDEPRMRELLRLYLQRAGYQLTEASDGAEALLFLEQAPFDLVLLDLMLPDTDGWTVCSRIRAQGDTPVIMLTARGDVNDRLRGLNVGADDYVTKPFDPREVVARVEAVLRRARPRAVPGSQPLRVGSLALDLSGRVASASGRALSLTPKEFDLLATLAEYPGQVLRREQLLRQVWGTEYAGEARTVDTHIKNLREKLGADAAILVTVWGVGYKLEV